MLLEVLLILPLYAIFFWIFWKVRDIIKAMSECFDVPDTPRETQQRAYLRNLIDEGKAELLPGKTPWTIKRLNEASDKKVDKLYKSLNEHKIQKDLISKLAGVDDIKDMMKDINSNYLIKNSASVMIGNLTPTIHMNRNTPMEILGSHVYSKFGSYLAPISLFCTIWNHLDWQSFAAIAAEREASALDEWDMEIIEKDASPNNITHDKIT